MACAKCDHKGYIESYTQRDGGFKCQVLQCFNCNDIKAYSKRVQEIAAALPQDFPSVPPGTPSSRFPAESTTKPKIDHDPCAVIKVDFTKLKKITR